MCLQLRSILQCPHCGFKVTEKIPLATTVRQWTCPACNKVSEAKKHCVFCDFGTVPCALAQQGKLET